MIRITLKVGKREVTETLDADDIQEIKEHFDECRSNGANPWLEKIDFDFYTRSLSIPASQLDTVNGGENAHFIFGYIESLGQSDHSPMQCFDWSDEMVITVQKEKE